MGMAGRLSHHALVSRRRVGLHRPRWHAKRFHHSAHLQQAGSALVDAVGEAGHAPRTRPMSLPVAVSPSAASTSVLDMPLNQLGWSAPMAWLALGWRDFMRAPRVGLFYGASFVLMGWLLVAVFSGAPAYTLALSAGFLLMGPFVCLGLYEASRHMERGEPVNMHDSLTAWRHNLGQLTAFAMVLLVLEMLWARAAMIVFAVSFDGLAEFDGSVSSLLTLDNLGFLVVYMAVGGVFAGLIYAISAISMPMMLERGTDAISAGLCSLRLVTTQPGVMLLWGALITLLIGLAMLPGFLGLLVVGPVVGHASWHAYRQAAGHPAPAEPTTTR